MNNRLGRLVIRSFLGPFVLTFVLILFILLMQFVWKYLDDLIGKGLDWTVVAELLFFQSTNLVPLAMPLAILLASIMTFGNLAENYELVALKSAGNSLLRIMQPLTLLVFIIAVGMFFFSNRVTPYANLKFRSLLYDIVHQKPMLELKEGVFYNGLEGFSMRVKRKDKDELMHDLIIYDHRQSQRGNSTVIRAAQGRMNKTSSGRYMKLKLMNGHSFEEQGMDGKSDPNAPHISSQFEEMEMIFDLSSFDFKESDEEKWTNNIPMQDMGQLSETADSLTRRIAKRKGALLSYADKILHLGRDSLEASSPLTCSIYDEIDALEPASKNRLLKIAFNMAGNSASYIESAQKDLVNRKGFVNRHWNEWHRKFTMAVACIVLFFIGAPLGGIIKKGGLGTPVIYSIIFFLIFHVTSITGEKMAKSGSLEPWQGMWLSTLILSPIALFLTYKANADRALWNFSWRRG